MEYSVQRKEWRKIIEMYINISEVIRYHWKISKVNPQDIKLFNFNSHNTIFKENIGRKTTQE